MFTLTLSQDWQANKSSKMFFPHRIISLALILGLLWSSSAADAPPARVKPVVVDIVQLREMAPVAEYSGAVISENDARLSSEINGRLDWIAQVGTHLSKGDVLAQLDDVFLQQQLQEEHAIIASEQAKYTLHNKQVARYESLIKKNNVAVDMLDQAISERAVSQNSMLAAQARLAQIQEYIHRSTLRAPFSGVISERYTQAGEWVQEGTELVRLIDIERPEITIRVPQNIYPLVALGDQVKIINSERSFNATIDTIVPVGTTTARLFELRLVPDYAAPPGTLVRAVIPTAQARKAISVHRDALVIRRGSLTVFRINSDNIAEQVSVSVGIGDGDYVEIIGSIKPHDAVVIRGGERLRAGESVRITNESN